MGSKRGALAYGSLQPCVMWRNSQHGLLREGGPSRDTESIVPISPIKVLQGG